MAIDLILQPFANSGDKTAPPQTDPNNFVNYTQGYTPDYEIDLSSGNTAAKAVERPVQNYLFYLLTGAVQAWQQISFAPWYSTMSVGGAAGYPKGAYVAVLVSGAYQIWRSLVANNTVNPTTTAQTSWEYVPLNTELLTQVAMPAGGVQESVPGGITNEVLTASTDFNTLTLGTWEFQTDALANGSAHAPVPTGGGGTLAGMLEAKQWKGTGSNTFNAQRYIDRNGGMFIRGAQNGTWTSWAPVGLATTTVSPGSYGSSTQVAQFTVNAFGQLTAASNVNIAFPVTSFNTRTGAITLTSGDVTTALGYTPVVSFNGRTGAVTLTQADITGAMSAPANTLFGNPTAGTTNPSFIGLANGLVMVGAANLGLGNITPTSLTISGTSIGSNGAVTIDTSSSGALPLTINNTGGNQAQIKMLGAGTTTPSKVLRVFGGLFQIVNDANTAAILTLNDGGGLSVTGGIATGTSLTVANKAIVTAGSLGIGTDPSSVAGVGNPIIGANNLICYNAGDNGILSLSDGNTARTQRIGFGAAGLSTFDAGIQYQPVNRNLSFFANTAQRGYFDALGNFFVTGGAVSGNSLTTLGGGTQGVQIVWNSVSVGLGRNEYINNFGGGSGGHAFYSRSASTGSLTFNGSIDIGGNMTLVGSINIMTSDARVKTNFVEREPVPIHRAWWGDYDRTDTGDHGISHLAQDVEKTHPHRVHERPGVTLPDGKTPMKFVDRLGLAEEQGVWCGREIDKLWAELRELRGRMN